MTLSQIYGQVFVQASYTFSSLFGAFLVIMTIKIDLLEGTGNCFETSKEVCINARLPAAFHS